MWSLKEKQFFFFNVKWVEPLTFCDIFVCRNLKAYLKNQNFKERHGGANLIFECFKNMKRKPINKFPQLSNHTHNDFVASDYRKEDCCVIYVSFYFLKFGFAPRQLHLLVLSDWFAINEVIAASYKAAIRFSSSRFSSTVHTATMLL